MSARITPYELILESLESSVFPSIRAEADQRGTDTRRRDQFLLLGFVGAALEDIVPDDAPAEALDEYGELLYQGFQFWDFGRRLYVLTDEATAELVSPSYTLGDWHLAAPPACYIQFPYQRFWARVSAEAPFEPVDGCFAVVDDTLPRPDAGAHLRLQLVLGLRADRPGVSLMSYRTDLDPKTPAKLAESPWRADAAPFANALPGGERKGYLSLSTTSELEALVLRVFHYLERGVGKLRAEEGSSVAGETRLAHVVV